MRQCGSRTVLDGFDRYIHTAIFVTCILLTVMSCMANSIGLSAEITNYINLRGVTGVFQEKHVGEQEVVLF